MRTEPDALEMSTWSSESLLLLTCSRRMAGLVQVGDDVHDDLLWDGA